MRTFDFQTIFAPSRVHLYCSLTGKCFAGSCPFQANVISRAANVLSASHEIIGNSMPSEMGGQHPPHTTERWRDGSVAEFNFGGAAVGADICADCYPGFAGVGKAKKWYKQMHLKLS